MNNFLKTISFLVILLIQGCQYNPPDSKSDKPDISPTLQLSVTQIRINYYETDSLNVGHALIPPRLYFDIIAINSSDTLYNLVLDEEFNLNTPRLSIIFQIGMERIDTLTITDMQAFKINKISPRDTSYFSVTAWIPQIEDKYLANGLTRKEIMKQIAANGNLLYLQNPNDTEILTKGLPIPSMEIEKSDSLLITYRDPTDHSIE